ncbi:unnamed protein product [Penicillium salamii]|uniref:Uncharacterized protein n=1 Tax=Penicillium salamii TaxID=1612424 RepID=A0A9W4IXA1_9EURO|nr:unnamed protein product [Penicillium salamii]
MSFFLKLRFPVDQNATPFRLTFTGNASITIDRGTITFVSPGQHTPAAPTLTPGPQATRATPLTTASAVGSQVNPQVEMTARQKFVHELVDYIGASDHATLTKEIWDKALEDWYYGTMPARPNDPSRPSHGSNNSGHVVRNTLPTQHTDSSHGAEGVINRGHVVRNTLPAQHTDSSHRAEDSKKRRLSEPDTRSANPKNPSHACEGATKRVCYQSVTIENQEDTSDDDYFTEDDSYTEDNDVNELEHVDLTEG